MYEANLQCESARACEALLKKYEQEQIKNPDLRRLIQPREVISRFAAFPPPQDDSVKQMRKRGPSFKRDESDRQRIINLRLQGLKFTEVSKRLNIPVGTCKSVMHQEKLKQKGTK